MARRKLTTTLLEPSEPTPTRVAEAASVADRTERGQRLSALLRDASATGAEVVAASRLLESMERTDANSATQGLPPPTVRPEMVMRCVRLLTAYGPKITLEALEILAQRYERTRAVAMQNRLDGKLFDFAELKTYRKRIFPRETTQEEPDGQDGGEGERSESGAGGAVTAEPSGLPELPEAAEPARPAADTDEFYGNGDGEPAPEDGTEGEPIR